MRFRVILILFLLIVVSVIITLNFFFHRSYESEMASQISQQQLLIVKTLAASMNDTLEHYHDEIEALARLLSVRGLDAEGLNKFVHNSFEEIDEDLRVDVVIMDRDLHPLYSSIPRFELRPEDRMVLQSLDQLEAEEDLAFLADPRESKTLRFMAPVRGADGSMQGAAMIVMYMDALNAKFLTPLRTGQRGHAWIMDGQGTLIYHPTMPEMVGRNINQSDEDCFRCHTSFNTERAILESPEIGFSSYIAPYGEDKLMAFSRVHFLDWIICLSIPYSEVTASIKDSMRLQSILVLSILCSTIFVAFVIVVINRDRVKAEARATYADKVREYADELEDIVRERTRELVSQNEKLDAVIGSINAGIGIFDAGRKCVWTNQVMRTWFGEETCGSLTLDDLAGHAEPVAEAGADWNAVIEDLHVQEVARLEFGPRRGVYQMSITPFHLPDGAPQLLLLLQDITDLKMAEEQMMHTQKLAALSRLSAGVAHEIGNPLTSISSFVQLLRETERDEFGRNALDTIYKHIQRIDAILKKMSSFSRSREDEIGPHEIRGLIDSTMELVRFDRRAKHVDLETDLPEGLPPVHVNGNQLIQIIMNLLLNAVDAQPDGGEIRVSASREGQFVHLTVTDQGQGIPPEDVDRIFEPFFTTKSTGTGLGLAVSHHIVRSFGGDIFVESTPGAGSTFTVRLPVSGGVAAVTDEQDKTAHKDENHEETV